MNYTTFTHIYENGHVVHYRHMPSGTCYHAETPEKVIIVLERYRLNQRKVRLYFGDTQTGESWLDELDLVGSIGRSTGPIKGPLLVTVGDIGGPALLDHCIIRIDSPRQVLYQHERFHVGELTIKQGKSKSLSWQVFVDMGLQARFATRKEAEQYIRFLQGQRFSKP